MKIVKAGALALAVLLFTAGCTEVPSRRAPLGLGGTSWQLVRFQGGDDKVLVPDDRARYTIAFGTDGGVSVRLDCNRGHGTWKSPGANQLEFGLLALTRAMCPPGSLHDHIVQHWGFVRSYVIRNGRLFLSLMADGGSYEFEPIATAAPVIRM
jgi:para-nitrobenzyl esterase